MSITRTAVSEISDADLLAEWNRDRGNRPNRRESPEQLAVIVAALRSRREEQMTPPQPLRWCAVCGCYARGEHQTTSVGRTS